MILRQSVLMSAGTVVNSILGVVFYILVGRALSVADFGYFSFLLGIGVMFSELGDLGLGSAIVKFGQGDKFRSVVTIAVAARVVTGLIFLVAGVVAQVFYPANFTLSALVAAFSLFVYVVLQSLLAKQRYSTYVGVNIFWNLVRLGIAGLLIFGNRLTAENGILAFVTANAASFLMGMSLIGWPLTLTRIKETLQEIASFCGWAGVSFGTASLAAKIDGPIVFMFSGPVAAGLYASAQRLGSIIPQINASIEGVFAPKLAKGENKKEFRQYILLAVAAAMGVFLVIPFAGNLVTLVFGQKYLPAIGVFQLILLGMVFVFLTGPFSAATLYRFGKANWHFASSLWQLVLSVILYWFFVPRFGATGAAMVFALVQAANLAFFVGLYAKNNRSHDR